jgi:hypothetical protein
MELFGGSAVGGRRQKLEYGAVVVGGSTGTGVVFDESTERVGLLALDEWSLE